MIIGTAGHIDHGKSSLVRALTNVDTDRLKEEKERGISIDLGFAYLPRPDGEVLGFVDVPGHEKFIHTMLAGASGIDFVMLVVAADDGVMPQTREHLAIVDLLGIRHGIAVITKADLVGGEQIARVEVALRHELGMTALADVPVHAVSTRTGDGIGDLQAMLDKVARAFQRRRATGRFRLAVDRCFTIAGTGTVVTGTVLSGKVAIGDHLTVSPIGKSARVRSLHAQNRKSETGQAGDRCALNLAGDGISRSAIERGDMVLSPDLHAPTNRIDATLYVLPDERKPLHQWFPVRLHHASTEIGARIVLLGDDEPQPGTSTRVQLVLNRPIAATAGDRYVIRDTSAQRTIGGGRFLDLRAPARKRRSPQRQAWLDACEIDDPVKAVLALLAVPPYFLDLTAFARDRALAADVAPFTDALDILILPLGQPLLAMLPEHWRAFHHALLGRLARFHDENPDLVGMGVERLRLLLEPRLPVPAFRVALQKLISEGTVALDGAWVRLSGHEVTMSDADNRLWLAVQPLIGGSARFQPPRVRDIASLLGEREDHIRHLLKLASRMGRVHEVAHDHFFLRDTIAEIVAVLGELDASFASGWFTAARFRDRVENGRKVAIQILEFLDRNSVTVRRGDLRRLNRGRMDLFGDLTHSIVGR
ncbi:MAG: selenocysteine-specific translation elongation factor [Phyllobacterium sp.]